MEWFNKGGLLMYPILLCSIFAFAIFLERFFLLINKKKTIGAFKKELESLVKEKPFNVKELKEILDILIEVEVKRLSRGIGALALIARVSTLLGLLGTVLGMIEVFKKIAEGKLGDPEALASGIWVALLTTVFGLSVAIPSVFMHGILSSLVSRKEEEFTKLGEEILKDYPKNER
ncbi:MAG: MotA/TolQ/ExbB proton channel family protein [Synergistetes bacterium]|nr:MotA/TolQ/ExbB proton channel family protein [Synergistota bacterium]MCX8128109.1 MotA/TolQ/ExbB proton channel family protein [Synergistota bacterium]MDW8192485.1 MotA/TolQ/ExbB proton channel family protein [Synergistota bacterium]